MCLCNNVQNQYIRIHTIQIYTNLNKLHVYDIIIYVSIYLSKNLLNRIRDVRNCVELFYIYQPIRYICIIIIYNSTYPIQFYIKTTTLYLFYFIFLILDKYLDTYMKGRSVCIYTYICIYGYKKVYNLIDVGLLKYIYIG